jgi:hypothetical protein
MKNNKFTGLLNSRTAPEATPTATTTKKSGDRTKQPTKQVLMPTAKPAATQTAAAEPQPEIQARIGRPAGKRSSDQFKQVTAYIDVETYRKTKIRLFEEDNKQEFSELVDKLLKDWLLK